jgi:rhodanese-related sulfurtransferase
MKKIVKLGLAVVIMSILAHLLFGGGADKDADIPALIKEGALVVDTRTAGEYAGEHIEGAINIPFDSIAHGIGKYQTDKAKCIIVYCHSGARSSSAKKMLMRAGYTNVVNGGSLSRMNKHLAE